VLGSFLANLRSVSRRRPVEPVRSGAWALAAVLAAGVAGAASYPTEYRFRSLETERVTVHFHDGLDEAARRAARLASELLEDQTKRYGVSVPRVHVVLADATDSPNGFATPLPYPLVGVQAAAPDGTDGFGNYDDWLRLVLSHELAHIVHLEGARGLPGFVRKLLGRAPYLFPNGTSPTWMVEGLATYEETEATAFGRGRNPDSRMVLRMAALDDRFPRRDEAVLGLDKWPGGQAPYLFGEAFLRDLNDHYGKGMLAKLVRTHSGNILPFLDELTAHRVTGVTYGPLWRSWARIVRDSYEEQTRSLETAGLTRSRALTDRGVRQSSPRFSPDGQRLAYTSYSLHRFGEVRVAGADDQEDHKLSERNGGSGLAWTPDGRFLVLDEPEIHRHFSVRSDLRLVEVTSGESRWLTRGERARDPDVTPDGEHVVFVRRLGDRSDLFELALGGGEARRLTESAPDTEWSGPRVSPGGDLVVASRWTPGGQLDLVLVDLATGAIVPLTDDRAKDVEPAWTPDGRHVVFRSDRDGVSNLYVLQLADRSLRRLTRVVGGAFTPDVSRDGRLVVFAEYTARGYDLRIMELDIGRLTPAEPFVDPYPPPPPSVEPSRVEARSYRPLGTLLPRFWSPYFGSIGGETRIGAVTGGADPLLRHAYGVGVDRGTMTGSIGFEGYYRYDRLYPTFTVRGSSRTRVGEEDARIEDRELTVHASFPLRSSYRSYQWLSLAYRREQEVERGGKEPGQLDTGGLELGWSLSTAKRYPYSISQVDGFRMRLSFLKEDPLLGSAVSLGKLSGDARGYLRLSSGSQVLALRLSAGTTFGQPGFTRSYTVGGFADGSLLDLVGTNQTVLRGYPDGAFEGRRFVGLNAEYRFPLAHPQRGLVTLPFFLRHLHGALFADAGHAWNEDFRLEDLKSSAGVALGTDLVLFHGLPMTATVGVARGFAEKRETQVYFRVGAAF
jgi:Tol biopolymer transport system component